ncbi:MAG: ornithine carbamoyltransferase, partial [Chloroflexota bacterium]|nr:ornithine carbamoyltransferase [Chloroflexota bacterium]
SHKLPENIWDQAKLIAQNRGSNLIWTDDPKEAVVEADIVYTDVWVSMGDEEEKEERLSIFSSYQVNEQLVTLAKNDFLFMHDMPAHRGEEISDGMLEHPNSVVYHQAENRLHAQKAVLAELFGY